MKQWLRGYAGNTPLEQIAAGAEYAISAVSTAMGGSDLPRLQLVRSIAAAVGAPQTQTYELWWAAALEEFRKKNPAEPNSPLEEFGQALQLAMLRADFGPGDVLTRMQQVARAGEFGIAPMSRATLSRMLVGATLPREEQMDLFFRSLIISDRELKVLWARYQSVSMALEIVKSAKRRGWLTKTMDVTA